MGKSLQKEVAAWKTDMGSSQHLFSLDTNCHISKVVVKICSSKSCVTDVTVTYAQNGILSDFIHFDCLSCQIDEKQELDVEMKKRIPVSASHIQLHLSNEGCWVKEIRVYEEVVETETVYVIEDTVEDMVKDAGNIAFGKPVHTSTGKEMAAYITDGSKQTFWQGAYYPAYIDIDLEKNFYLDRVEIYTPQKESLAYRIYTSMDGRNFNETDINIKDDAHIMNNKEARLVRIFIEYDASFSMPTVNLVRIMGEESGTPLRERPEIQIEKYEESVYSKEVTKEDTCEEVLGIVERRIGSKYRDWFSLELTEHPVHGKEYDYFELTDEGNRIRVRGNSGVSLAVGINHYLKYYCQVHISQVGDQVRMPKKLVRLQNPVFRETRAKVRYAYNYCTHSYTMAFWGENEWRRELDWLALNGVNLVLDITGQEEVIRRFLTKIGYKHEDIKDYIAGPAYYAWAYMANLYGFGGPVHDSWFEERTELARKNQYIMRKLGMYPVLQGYSGMVPVDISKYDEETESIAQGTWCSFERPSMLYTTSECFKEYARMFYQTQREVYGDYSHYYATDPFHEGGITAGISSRAIGKAVLSAMLQENEGAVWVIQSWQANPTSELLKGVADVKNGKKHALILDLYAEKTPNYRNGKKENAWHGYEVEFNHTPWVFCMLNNFGGRSGLHGHLDNLVTDIPKAWNTCDDIIGIGITPEASENNPVLYDFFFETIWQKNADKPMQQIFLEQWLDAYVVRRYGALSHAAREAWKILVDTVYKAEYNNLGQGAPECVANARPALEIQAASTWGNAVISYDVKELERAAILLSQDYELLKESEGYQYDLATVRQQVLSNHAKEYHSMMSEAVQTRDWKQFEKWGNRFLMLLDEMEEVTSTCKFHRLDRWLKQVARMTDNTDDFTKRLYMFNAKAIITTWGSYNQSEIGQLHDYSNRQWAGLIKDFYKPRWNYWIQNRTKQTDWFKQEWQWIWSEVDNDYT